MIHVWTKSCIAVSEFEPVNTHIPQPQMGATVITDAQCDLMCGREFPVKMLIALMVGVVLVTRSGAGFPF